MANDDNLKDFSQRTESEQREIAKMGGKASGETRRKKKLMREQMELLLSLPVQSPEVREQMESIGIDPDNMDNQMALITAAFRQGIKGDMSAFNSIRDLIGEKPVEVIKQDLTVNKHEAVKEMEEYMDGAWMKEKDTEGS